MHNFYDNLQVAISFSLNFILFSVITKNTKLHTTKETKNELSMKQNAITKQATNKQQAISNKQ